MIQFVLVSDAGSTSDERTAPPTSSASVHQGPTALVTAPPATACSTRSTSIEVGPAYVDLELAQLATAEQGNHASADATAKRQRATMSLP
jgi:hypothetical protein